MNLAQANKVMESQLHRRCFSFLGKRKSIAHEYKIGMYKTDLFINDTNTMIEIKSILAFSRETCFPTVYSERAVKQLEKISRLLDEGYQACYMFVSLNPQVNEISINKQDDDFYQAFLNCVNKGMAYCAFSIRLIGQEPEIYSRIKFAI